jgi:hypothetical protein
LLSKARFVLHW